jgi:hypothetical protein
MPPRPIARRERGKEQQPTNTRNLTTFPADPAKTATSKQPNIIPPVALRNGMELRGKRDPHPAAPVLPTPRRSTELVQAEKRRITDAKAAKAAAHTAAIIKAAELEDQMKEQDQMAEKQANHPPTIQLAKKTKEKIW